MAMHRRLAKEIPQLEAKTLLKDGLAVEGTTNWTAQSEPAKGTSFTALLAGPKDSPYEGGVFRLKVIVPKQYPLEPPKMQFETRLFHPNIGRGHTPGAICLDILRKEAWSPALTLERTLISIASLLADPNPASPMDGEAAKLYQSDRGHYNRRVREWVAKYAKPGGGSGEDAWVSSFGKDDAAPAGPANADCPAAPNSAAAPGGSAATDGSAATASSAAPDSSPAEAPEAAEAAEAPSRPLAEELRNLVIDLDDSDDERPAKRVRS